MPVRLPDAGAPPNERKKPPRRTWRHLPPSPPLADPLPTPDPTQLIPGAATTAVIEEVAPEAPAPVEQPRRRRRVWLAAGAVGLAGALVAGTVLTLRDDSEPSAASSATLPTTPGGSPGSTGGSGGTAVPGSVQEIVKKVSPAVVQLEPNMGVGSGVIVDKSGLILTAHHVVAGTETLTVKLADGTELPGRVVGRRPERDLAVVAVSPDSDLPAAELASEGTVEVGEPVVAIGSPFGISQTVTSGIVSGLDREIDSPIGKLTGLIQTDAPINPGNSGGPLIDADAKVIGINSAIASTSGASAGVGFAVPVVVAEELLAEVRDNGGVDAPSVPDDSSSQIPGFDPNDPLGGLVPPGLDDLFGGGGDPNQLLQQLLDELLRASQGLDQLDPGAPSTPDEGEARSRDDLGLFRVGELPEGWSQARSSSSTSSSGSTLEGRHEVTLTGPDGRVVIVAERGADARAHYDELESEATDVAGTEGRRFDGGVAWMASDDVLVVVKADPGVSSEDVDRIVESIEVVS